MFNFGRKPTLFHITHWKAGSQWVYVVLRELLSKSIVHPKVNVAHVVEEPILSGKIYPTVYLNAATFHCVKLPDSYKTFFVLRDMRDTLVSRYFSFLKSHPTTSKTGTHSQVIEQRTILEKMSLQDGLIHMLNIPQVQEIATIQMDWYKRADLTLRYEEMLEDDIASFKKIVGLSGRKISDTKLKNVVINNRFANVTGRKRGEEDQSSHFRKGVSGDWQNYFDDTLKQAFKEKYAHVLIETGYEKDDIW